MASARRFRIALSFAGEKRDFVHDVAVILANLFGEEKILYDKFHEAEFAQHRLAIDLPDLYNKKSDLVIAILCARYSKKKWTGMEWTGIHSLFMKHATKRVMLARYGHSTIKGLFEGAGFVELDNKTPEDFAKLILERLALNENRDKKHYVKDLSSKNLVHETHNAKHSGLPYVTSFFGRESEIKTINEALSPETRTWGVLIDGPGGIGKTTLAICAAERISDTLFKRKIFLSAKEREIGSDGVVELRGYVLPDYPQILNEIATQLGKPEFLKSPEIERIKEIRTVLQTEPVLLIIDNLESLSSEHSNQIFSFLGRLPQGCKAIVTSRRRGDVDARIIRLGRLEQEPALALLEQLARDRPLLQRATENERLRLYEETGGNPLLMRWVVGQLGRGRCITIESALDFLRNAPEGNDPLEFIFGDLIETFTDSEFKVLAALTYFTRSIETKYIATIGKVSNRTAETALLSLCNRAIVVPDRNETMFSLVPMIKDFIRKARPSLVFKVGNELEKYSYAKIIENGGDKIEKYDYLDKEWHTIAPALQYFFLGPSAQMQTICNALNAFLMHTNRLDELLAINLRAEKMAVKEKDFLSAGWRAYQAGMTYFHRREIEPLTKCIGKAEKYWTDVYASARERAMLIRLRAMLNLIKGDFTRAKFEYEQCRDMRISIAPDTKEVSIALNDLAAVKQKMRDFDGAIEDCLEALRIAKMVDYKEGVATMSSNVVELLLDKEDWKKAEMFATEWIEYADRYGRFGLSATMNIFLAKAKFRLENRIGALKAAMKVLSSASYASPQQFEEARTIVKECDRL